MKTLDDGLELRAPKLGYFVPTLSRGQVVRAGDPIGRLHILNHRHTVLASKSGVVLEIIDRPGRGVSYKERIATLGAMTTSTEAEASEAEALAQAGQVVRAPIHGIFYIRPSPTAPPYVKVGDTIRRGQTVGLVEVMKTFNPVLFEDADTARVLVIHADDQTEVEAGEALLTIEPV